MIYRVSMDAPQWDRGEIARYARANASDERIAALIEDCIKEAEDLIEYRVCYTVDAIERCGAELSFCGINTHSAVISKAVKGCESILLFAATIGARFDRLIATYSRLEPSKALILQAIGAERIESLCDAFCYWMDAELSSTGKSLRPRVSPGYGDIPLVMQKDFFRVLDCERKIGLTLNESLMMSPSKSVTALAGIGSRGIQHSDKCSQCEMTDCDYRQ